jgi:hypothetical protein
MDHADDSHRIDTDRYSKLASRGLMFALPFVFLIPGAFLGLLGGTLLWGLNRSSRSLPSETKIFQKPTLGVGSNKTQDNTSQRQE